MTQNYYEYIYAYKQACLLELKAIKPGNVGYHSDGHGMRVEQFEISAEVSANALFESSTCVGERIYHAVDATREAVGDNTNLGIILLAAPIVQALVSSNATELRGQLGQVLASLSIEDAKHAYKAIQLATPGGMGEVNDQDVANEPTVTLLEAMRLSAQSDRIAHQYISQFEDVFEHNLPIYKQYLGKWGSHQWAATAIFLNQWQRVPDTLIIRKKGLLKAQEISDMIAPLASRVLASEDPTDHVSDLLSLDNELKRVGINPGTTADITVATLFVALLESIALGRQG